MGDRKHHGGKPPPPDDEDEEEGDRGTWTELPTHPPRELHAMQKIRDRALIQKLWDEISTSLAAYARNLKYIRG